MNYTKEIFQHANVRGITEYLLYGTPLTESNKGYEARMEEAFHQFDKETEKCIGQEKPELADSVNKLVSEATDVYTEIGLQAGFLIMIDMMKNIEYCTETKEGDTQKIDYMAMYDSLFRDVSKAIQLLQENGRNSVEKAEQILKRAQCATEELYIASDEPM